MEVEFLKKWNVPVIQAYTLISSYEEWKAAFDGMNAMEVSISVSLPEFDGICHGVPIATKKVLENGDVCYLPIAERIRHLVRKAGKWAEMCIRDRDTGDPQLNIKPDRGMQLCLYLLLCGVSSGGGDEKGSGFTGGGYGRAKGPALYFAIYRW